MSTHGAEWSNDDLQQNVSAAGWVDDNLKVVPETTVGSLVPVVFDAYARIQYPTRGNSSARPKSAKPVAAMIDILARSTNTPGECWFAIWEGNTALDDIRESAPTADIAGYNYFLLRGSVSRAADTLNGLSPNLWWPTDHAWCMAQHFDFPSAYFGGSRETMANLLVLNDIESGPVRVGQIVTAKYDRQDDRAQPPDATVSTIDTLH